MTNMNISFLNLPHQLDPQIYPLRARFNGVRESELMSFEGSAISFDELKVDADLDDDSDNLKSRITSLEEGASITGLTYNGSPITLEGITSLVQRLEDLEAHIQLR